MSGSHQDIGYRTQTDDLPLFTQRPEIAKATDTKAEAYAAAVRRGLGDRAMQVFRCILEQGPISNMEIGNALEMSINRVTPRVYELREQGMVAMDVKRPCRVTGMMVRTWVVPQAVLWRLINDPKSGTVEDARVGPANGC